MGQSRIPGDSKKTSIRRSRIDVAIIIRCSYHSIGLISRCFTSARMANRRRFSAPTGPFTTNDSCMLPVTRLSFYPEYYLRVLMPPSSLLYTQRLRLVVQCRLFQIRRPLSTQQGLHAAAASRSVLLIIESTLIAPFLSLRKKGKKKRKIVAYG